MPLPQFPGPGRPEQRSQKRALVIGCNYPGTSAELKVCHDLQASEVFILLCVSSNLGMPGFLAFRGNTLQIIHNLLNIRCFLTESMDTLNSEPNSVEL